MKRIALAVAFTLVGTGCSPKPPDELEKDKLREELKEAQSRNADLKLATGLLMAAILVALIVGAALGSKAKEDRHGR